jgi:SSS family solute:Na+ symporter
MEFSDYLVFFIYMAGITLFGSSFYRKNKTSSAFTLGDSDIPSWVIAMSIFATFVSSISFLALPGIAYLSNWNTFVFSLSIPVATLVAVKFFIPLYRRANSPSAYTYLENRFGPWARIYVSLCYLLTQLMRTGTILYLLALAVNTFFGWDLRIIIVLTGITIMLYSMLGGLRAVVWTDAIQGILLISGALLCAVMVLFRMPEGPGQLFDIAAAHNKFSLGSFSGSLTESTFWVVLVYGIFINLQNYGIDQNYVQRYMASRNDREARRSAFLGGMLYIPVSMIFLFIGTALFSFYHSGTGGLPAYLMESGNSDKILPYFIVTELPAGVSGLVIASIFAAGMSTVSTSFNSSATVFLTDYYQRYFRKSSSEKESMKVLYISSFVIGSLGITIGTAMINVRSALDAWWKLASIFSGGMLGLFLLGTFSRSRHMTGPVVGVISGILVILWLSAGPLVFGKEIPGGRIHNYLIIVIGTVTIFFIGFFISLLAGQKVLRSGRRVSEGNEK